MAHEPEIPDTDEPLTILLWVVLGLGLGLLLLGGLASYFLAPQLEPFHNPTRPIVPLAEKRLIEQAETAPAALETDRAGPSPADVQLSR